MRSFQVPSPWTLSASAIFTDQAGAAASPARSATWIHRSGAAGAFRRLSVLAALRPYPEHATPWSLPAPAAGRAAAGPGPGIFGDRPSGTRFGRSSPLTVCQRALPAPSSPARTAPSSHRSLEINLVRGPEQLCLQPRLRPFAAASPSESFPRCPSSPVIRLPPLPVFSDPLKPLLPSALARTLHFSPCSPVRGSALPHGARDGGRRPRAPRHFCHHEAPAIPAGTS